MARIGDRGGADTRARIAATAAGLFVERGFDAVTVADVARAAGVSSVTVFKHFPRKEDLFLDRAADASELLRDALGARAARTPALTALHDAAVRLLDEHHPLSALDDRSVPFFRTVAGSSALVARAREIAADLQRQLTGQLEADPGFDGDAELVAAFFIAGCSTWLVGAARLRVAGASAAEVEPEHRARLERLFDALRSGAA